MKKITFKILTIIFCVCIPILLSACSTKHDNNDNATNLILTTAVEGENTETKNTPSNPSDNSQIIGTLIGGLCSIFGGAAGAAITVIVTNNNEKKKLQSNSFKSYFRLIRSTQSKMEEIGSEKFNIEECEKLINDLNNEFKNNDDLSLYIDYHNKFEKYKKSLDSLIATARQKNYNSSEIYESFQKAFEKEKHKIEKKIQ